MSLFSSLLRTTPEGLYCEPATLYIDPIRPVARAVITHGHSDHARLGHEAVLATAETLAIMRTRYGEGFAQTSQTARLGEKIAVGDVTLTLVPAGHVLGSAQVAINWKGTTLVISGDYKRGPDPTCQPFEPVNCQCFVTEATFGLPIFRFPAPEDEIAKLLKSVRLFPECSHIVGCYALGKAQRVISLLRAAGYRRRIYVHGAITAMNGLYQSFGVDLGDIAPATSDGGDLAGEIIIAPPSATTDKWTRRFSAPIPALASGWMQVRARARQRRIELPMVISDHCDWLELTSTICELGCEQVWITHGNEEALLRWASLNGIAAKALDIAGYEDEEQ